MTIGLVFLMAGGPPVADRLGLPPFHFLNRQVMYSGPYLIASTHSVMPTA
jgi:cell division protein FtsW